VAMIGGSN